MLDPLASIVLSFLITLSALPIVLQALPTLLDAAPAQISVQVRARARPTARAAAQQAGALAAAGCCVASHRRPARSAPVEQVLERELREVPFVHALGALHVWHAGASKGPASPPPTSRRPARPASPPARPSGRSPLPSPAVLQLTAAVPRCGCSGGAGAAGGGAGADGRRRRARP